MAHLLLIDDDAVFVPQQVRQAFPAPAYRVVVAQNGNHGVELVRRAPPDVVLLDLHLPDRPGLDVYRSIRAIDARIPVIFIANAKTADAAIETVKHGAFDYLHKPLDLEQLHRVVTDALEVARIQVPLRVPEAALHAETDGAMLGASPRMLDIYKAIGRVAAQDVTVLITGESGTGKELVARAIYQHSARSAAPFLALNCAAIPENLLESELFGHERGAFTGADRRRVGKFEQCNGGTMLLDEIGDMPLALQAKILRLLQDQTFERLGGNETIRTDVRLIASTHRDLRVRAAEDKFRPDLYYRLGVFTIHLPPLRERIEDLPILVQHYLRRFSAELGREVREAAPEAMARLRSYSWPGNIRELQSVLRQALLRASGPVLLPGFLPELSDSAAPVRSSTGTNGGTGVGTSAGMPGGNASAGASNGHSAELAFDLERFIRQRLAPATNDLSAETHREVDRLLMTLALEYTHGNHRDASKLLGISRQTMRVKLRSLNLHVAHSVEPDDDE